MDAAELSTPSYIRTELSRFGGRNPFNRANWRLVLAERRIVRRGGIVSKDGVQDGYRDVPKYPCKGWVLERWFPAVKFGTRSDWENAKSIDGITPLLGPYPSEGDYFMLAGPFQRMPEIGDLKKAISMHIREEESRPSSYAAMLKAEIDADTAKAEAAEKKATEDLAHFYQTEVEPVLHGTSLEAARIRQDLAQQMGDWSHQGV